MKRVLIIGAVNSTNWILNRLIFHGFEIVGLLGHEPKNTSIVSGWVDFKSISNKLNIPYKGFSQVNDSNNLIWAKEKRPEVIFAVGFSQLLSNEWFDITNFGCIGFHPTKLPKGRGRAPLAWLVHDLIDGAATFFLMGKGADDGPVFIQEPFSVSSTDDASSLERKIEKSINLALDKWLPDLKMGVWNPIPQNDTEATYFGKRSIEDGLIDWRSSAFDIDRLIKASTYPHPGAYSYFKNKKIIIWASEIEVNIPIKGTVGRVLIKNDSKGLLVQTGDGLLWVKKIEIDANILVGDKLGYSLEDEIYRLKLIINNIKSE